MNFLLKNVFLAKIIFLPLSIVSVLIPKRKRIFFPSFSHVQWSGNHRVLFEYLLSERAKSNTNYDVKAVVDECFIDIDIDGVGYPIGSVVHSNSLLKIIYYSLTSKFVFFHHGTCDSPVFIFPFFTRTIMLNHGIHFKKTGASLKGFKISVFLDSILIKKHYVSSEIDAMAVSANYYVRSYNAIPLGIPRNDILVESDLDVFYRFDIEKLERIIGDSKVLLYAPTWRDKGKAYNFSLHDVLKIEEFCKKNNFLFLYAGHPYLKGRVCPTSEFIIDANTISVDIQILIRKSSILITDYSSIWLDALPLNLPVISFAFDYDDFRDYRGEHYPFPEMFPGDVVFDIDGLLGSLVESLSGRENKNYDFVKRLFHKNSQFNASMKIINDLGIFYD